MLRNTTGNSKKNYYGYRDAINFVSQYNFDLDNRIIFGLDNEFDKAELYNYYTGSAYLESDESIFSQYFDVQIAKRKNLYDFWFKKRLSYHCKRLLYRQSYYGI